MRAEIDELYNCNCGRCKALNIELKANFSDQSKILKEVEGLEDGVLSTEIFNHTAEHLHNSIDSVFTAKYGDKNYNLVNELKKNSSEFSAFKSAYFTALIKDKEPKEHDAIIANYERQLTTEGNLATRSARGAKQWQEYERTKDIYPNLEYLSSRSADKRAEHKELYGVIKPIDDNFWKTHYPPNGWGCKCRTGKSDDTPTGEVPNVAIPKGLAGNVALDKVIFTNSHPFIKGVGKVGKKRIKKQFEQLKATIKYNNNADYETNNNSSIYVHQYADKNDVELNFEVAKILVDKIPNLSIKITPHIIIEERKNPEYLINGAIGDLKEMKGKSPNSNLKSAIKQNCEEVVLFIRKESLFANDVNFLKQKIKGNLLNKTNKIKTIYIIDIDESITIYDVSDFTKTQKSQ